MKLRHPWNKRKFKRSLRRHQRTVAIAFACAALASAAGVTHGFGLLGGSGHIHKENLVPLLGKELRFNRLPKRVDFAGTHGLGAVSVRYTLQPELQKGIQELFELYKPDYGSFVAMDPATGQILSIASYTRTDTARGNLAVQATFPAASVFKMVTASAAIDQRKVSPETVIPFNGRSHTLYRRQLASNETNRWTRFVSVREAFARSINTVFGKIGAFYLGYPLLSDYVRKFGFNRRIPADFELEPSTVELEAGRQWSIVETASGFTQNIKLSPVHAAMMAASVANNGVMMEPYLVESLHSDKGEEVYRGLPRVAGVTMDAASAAEVRTLMRETVKSGTSRSVFRGFFKGKKYKDVEVGGKTGSLNAEDPKGRCDWFVGYAHFKGRQIAFAAVTVHEKFWRVKSAYLARKFIESYVNETLENPVYVGSAGR